MTTKATALLTLLLFAAPGVSSASIIVDLVDREGNDSGWSVVLADDVHNGVVVDAVTGDYVRIEIAKTFTLPPEGGVFPGNTIAFLQRLDDAGTVATIKITSEIVDGGVVPDGHTFFPGATAGRLCIDVDLAAEDSDFTLEQVPTPEPGTIALLAVGGAIFLVRRRRRRGA